MKKAEAEDTLQFGEALKRLRLETKLSQTEFARRLGLSPTNVCDLEKGRVIPSVKRAIWIAQKLGVSERFFGASAQIFVAT